MSKLFTPVRVGSVDLGHRVAMAPLTRYRSKEYVALPIVKEYYAQRASTPGTLLISEATPISPRAGASFNAPGIWTPEQIAAWKEITDAIHAKGSKIFCQLWHMGRAGHTEELASFGLKLKSSSAVAIDATYQVPDPLTEDEIWEVISEYAVAARNAVEKAGFDGVEIHGANGYLPDQFLQDVCNKRTDEWGGSVENRSRFHLEVTKAVINAVGADRTAMRLNPHSDYLSMRMADSVRMPQFAHVVGELRKLRLAYLHLVEPLREGESNEPLVRIWDNVSPVLLASGFTPASALEAVDRTYKGFDVVVVFGRHFIANPDLVYRLKAGVSLNKYDRSTFYLPHVEKGYTDYPFSQQFGSEVTKGAGDEAPCHISSTPKALFAKA